MCQAILGRTSGSVSDGIGGCSSVWGYVFFAVR